MNNEKEKIKWSPLCQDKIASLFFWSR